MMKAKGRAGAVRIIGGQWRGTRLPVADLDGLRPSADRVRETLFNWLMPALPGARVLDVFAGSGALGLEALSRGAAMATLVERDAALTAQLRSTVARLQDGDRAEVVCADTLAWLATPAVRQERRFDIAFIDPPFAGDLWGRAIEAVMPVMAADGWLYVEASNDAHSPLPPDWRLHREGRTREVAYRLWRRV